MKPGEKIKISMEAVPPSYISGLSGWMQEDRGHSEVGQNHPPGINLLGYEVSRLVHDIHILPTDAISVRAPAWKLVGVANRRQLSLQLFRAPAFLVSDIRRHANKEC